MPLDTWASPPIIRPRGPGYSIPVGITRTGDGTEADPYSYEGVRLDVRALTATDIQAAVTADPDATSEHLSEALGLALDETAPTAQDQLDDVIDTLLEG